MAVSIINPATGLFDPYTRDKEQIGTVLKLALFGKAGFPRGTSLVNPASSSAAATDIVNIKKQVRTAQVMCAQLMGRRGVDFKGVFDTSDASALAVAFSLTTLGVTFPAATVRNIRINMMSSNDTVTIYQEIEQEVWGNNGTTPVLGEARLIKAHRIAAGVYQRMGLVKLNALRDVESTENSPGTALGTFTNGVAALTFPPSRAVHVIGAAVDQVTYDSATSPSGASISAISASAGTAVYNAWIGAGTTGVIPGASDPCAATLELWPQAQSQLALNTNAVEVHLRSTLADILRHRIEVFVGPALTDALSA